MNRAITTLAHVPNVSKKVAGLLHFLLMLIILGLVLLALPAQAQIHAPPPPVDKFMNSTALGFSYGQQNDRDADFYGASIDYGRLISDGWFVGIGLSWDRETESFVDKPDKQVESFTLQATISYSITDRLSLTTGLGKGFANSDNPQGNMKFAGGDLGTGLALGYALPGFLKNKRDSIGLSLAYEYNLSAKETSVSFDVSFGLSF